MGICCSTENDNKSQDGSTTHVSTEMGAATIVPSKLDLKVDDPAEDPLSKLKVPEKPKVVEEEVKPQPEPEKPAEHKEGVVVVERPYVDNESSSDSESVYAPGKDGEDDDDEDDDDNEENALTRKVDVTAEEELNVPEPTSLLDAIQKLTRYEASEKVCLMCADYLAKLLPQFSEEQLQEIVAKEGVQALLGAANVHSANRQICFTILRIIYLLTKDDKNDSNRALIKLLAGVYIMINILSYANKNNDQEVQRVIIANLSFLFNKPSDQLINFVKHKEGASLTMFLDAVNNNIDDFETSCRYIQFACAVAGHKTQLKEFVELLGINNYGLKLLARAFNQHYKSLDRVFNPIEEFVGRAKVHGYAEDIGTVFAKEGAVDTVITGLMMDHFQVNDITNIALNLLKNIAASEHVIEAAIVVLNTHVQNTRIATNVATFLFNLIDDAYLPALTKANAVAAIVAAVPVNQQNGYFIKFSMTSLAFMLKDHENVRRLVDENDGIAFLFRVVGSYGRASGTAELALLALNCICAVLDTNNDEYVDQMSKQVGSVNSLLDSIDVNDQNPAYLKKAMHVLLAICSDKAINNLVPEQLREILDVMFNIIKEKEEMYTGYMTQVMTVLCLVNAKLPVADVVEEDEIRALGKMLMPHRSEEAFVRAFFRLAGVLASNGRNREKFARHHIVQDMKELYQEYKDLPGFATEDAALAAEKLGIQWATKKHQ